MLKRFRIVSHRVLFQRRIHMTQIVWRNLVDVIVSQLANSRLPWLRQVARGLFCGSFCGK
ncbi:Uncharacterised protein [Klebsiella pneumoniae]|nr:Uncharacterised protein [Klebsiella pneumoniae]